jgi:hypothetical protein
MVSGRPTPGQIHCLPRASTCQRTSLESKNRTDVLIRQEVGRVAMALSPDPYPSLPSLGEGSALGKLVLKEEWISSFSQLHTKP